MNRETSITDATVSCGMTVKSYYVVPLKVTQPQGGLTEQGWVRGLKEGPPAPLALLDHNASLLRYRVTEDLTEYKTSVVSRTFQTETSTVYHPQPWAQ